MPSDRPLAVQYSDPHLELLGVTSDVCVRNLEVVRLFHLQLKQHVGVHEDGRGLVLHSERLGQARGERVKSQAR